MARTHWFNGKKLTYSTIKNYASDKEHPDHEDAKEWLAKYKEKKEVYESSLDRYMNKIDRRSEQIYLSYKIAPHISVPVKVSKNIIRSFSMSIPKPSKAFSMGFNAFANPTEENNKKIIDNLAHAAREVFGKDLKEGEEKKIGECLAEGKKSAMKALGEASLALVDQTARVGISLMTAIVATSLSVSGKAIAGGLWIIPTAYDGLSNLDEANKVGAEKKKDPEKEIQDVIGSIMGGTSKDEMKAVAQFINEKGEFDSKGYMKEMEKVIKEVKQRASKFIQETNEKNKIEKAASRVAFRFLNGWY